MISKLESAGLGFYVKATEAQEKLGTQFHKSIFSNALLLFFCTMNR